MEEAGSGLGSGGQGSVPSELQDAVLVSSQPMPEDSMKVKGHDFSEARLHLDTGNVVICVPHRTLTSRRCGRKAEEWTTMLCSVPTGPRGFRQPTLV